MHMVGGMAALLGAMMVGAREGRFKVDANGKVQEGNLKQHSVVAMNIIFLCKLQCDCYCGELTSVRPLCWLLQVLAASGTFLLWFGWYGFNPGTQATLLCVHVVLHPVVCAR